MLFSLTLLVEPSITASAAQSELFSPKNLRVSNVTSDSLVLSWDAVSGATYYDVKAVSTTGRHSVVFHDTPSSTSITISGLHTDNEYDLMVSSRNDTQSSVAKVISSATEHAGVSIPSNPTNLSTSNVTANSVELSWNAVSDAVNYEIEVQHSETGVVLEVEQSPSTSFNVDGLLPDTSYTLWVLAENQYGLISSGSSVLVTTNPLNVSPPSNPTNLSTSNVTTNSFELSWNAVSDATNYEIKVNDNYGDLKSILDTSSASARIDGLLPDTRYTVWISAENENGTSSGARISVSTIAEDEIEEIISESEIPQWVGTTAGWWADEQIDDGTFLTAIEFLLEDRIIILEADAEVEALAAQAIADASEIIADAAEDAVNEAANSQISISAEIIAQKVTNAAMIAAMNTARDSVNDTIEEELDDAISSVSEELYQILNDEIYDAAITVSDEALEAAREASEEAESVEEGISASSSAGRDAAIAKTTEVTEEISKIVRDVAADSAQQAVSDVLDATIDDAVDAAVESAINAARVAAEHTIDSELAIVVNNSAGIVSTAASDAVNEYVEIEGEKIDQLVTDESSDDISIKDIENSFVPEWVRSNAEWWADSQIDDDTFANGIKFLLEKEIIIVTTNAQTVAIEQAHEQTVKASQDVTDRAIAVATYEVKELSSEIIDKLSDKISASKNKIGDAARTAALDAVSSYVSDAGDKVNATAMSVALSEAEKAAEKVSAAGASAARMAAMQAANSGNDADAILNAADNAGHSAAKNAATGASETAAQAISDTITEKLSAEVEFAARGVADEAIAAAIRAATETIEDEVEILVEDAVERGIQKVTDAVLEESELASDRAAKAVALAAAEAAEEKAAEEDTN